MEADILPSCHCYSECWTASLVEIWPNEKSDIVWNKIPIWCVMTYEWILAMVFPPSHQQQVNDTKKCSLSNSLITHLHLVHLISWGVCSLYWKSPAHCIAIMCSAPVPRLPHETASVPYSIIYTSFALCMINIVVKQYLSSWIFPISVHCQFSCDDQAEFLAKYS